MRLVTNELFLCYVFFFFKQKTAYEMRISDWSSDVCSSDLNFHHITQPPTFGTCAIGRIEGKRIGLRFIVGDPGAWAHERLAEVKFLAFCITQFNHHFTLLHG